MNYYEHHLGDYVRDAAHLSMIEEGAYRRLLDAYYIREAALPADVADCCKLARASTKTEREAVAYVLRSFFKLDDAGWRQGRCDAEIAAYQKRVEHSQRVGKLGGRPKKQKPGDNPGVSVAEPERKPSSLHTPDSIHQITPQAAPVAPPPATPAAEAPKKRPVKRDPGKTYTRRCPEDFAIGAAEVGWAKAHAPGVDVPRETVKFRNHTFGTARCDWPATWQNWMLEAFDRQQRTTGAKSFRAQDSETNSASLHKLTGGLLGRRPPPPPQGDILEMQPHHDAIDRD